VVAPQLSISDADRAAFSVFFPAKRVVFIASERMECGRSGSNSKTLFGIARKVQKRRLGRELPLSALDAILKSDSPGNRPEFSPQTTKASSRRRRKSDAMCSPGPATTGKNRKRSANGPIPHRLQESLGVLGSFPRGSTAGEIFKCNSPATLPQVLQVCIPFASTRSISSVTGQCIDIAKVFRFSCSL
jgi:hypothetical protein